MGDGMSVQEQIKDTVENHKVVLFMKGTRMFPQCGFSARAIEILKSSGAKKIKDVNVLTDPEVRQGIKDFSNWPTIPQCYIDGKFVGGSDILTEMYESGELHELLGGEPPQVASEPPTITITDKAKKAFAQALSEAGDDVLRFDVSSSFSYDLYFGPKNGNDLITTSNGIGIHTAPAAAARIEGTQIDFVDGPDGAGFKIDNPNEPARVDNIRPSELNKLLDAGDTVHLFDVRSEKERGIAAIAAAKPFDGAAQDQIAQLPKDSMLVFHCHHGVRSRSVAEQVLSQGYTKVYNLTGGIDAWSVDVDDSVPRY